MTRCTNLNSWKCFQPLSLPGTFFTQQTAFKMDKSDRGKVAFRDKKCTNWHRHLTASYIPTEFWHFQPIYCVCVGKTCKACMGTVNKCSGTLVVWVRTVKLGKADLLPRMINYRSVQVRIYYLVERNLPILLYPHTNPYSVRHF